MRLGFALILAASALFSVGSSPAMASPNDGCTEPEAEILRSLLQKEEPDGPHQDKLKGLAVLEKGEAECRASAANPQKGNEQIAEKKQLAYKQMLAALDAEEKTAPAPNASEVLGIFPPEDIPPIPKHTFSFDSGNVWQGYAGPLFVTIYAGDRYGDPKQGMLIVQMEGNADSDFQIDTIPTPTATGPVKVVSEAGGTLTLKSVAGTFKAEHGDDAPPEYVTTPGGATYYFNIAARKFQASNAFAKPSGAPVKPPQGTVLSQ
jgi:hypothetical protein